MESRIQKCLEFPYMARNDSLNVNAIFSRCVLLLPDTTQLNPDNSNPR